MDVPLEVAEAPVAQPLPPLHEFAIGGDFAVVPSDSFEFVVLRNHGHAGFATDGVEGTGFL